MQCFHCNTQFPDGMSNCPNCGAPIKNQFTQNANPYAQPQGQPYGYTRPLSKKEFLHHPNLNKCRKNIKESAIFLYVCAVISLILGFIIGSYGMIIDVILMLGLALGIHLAQSRACAVCILIYSIFNTIVMTIERGRLSGYLIIIAGIYSVMATFQFQKAWKNYQQTGFIPYL